MTHRQPNDLGGLAAGPIDRREGEHLAWQVEITATQAVLARPAHRLIRLDELRRGMEDLGPDYDRLGYFERIVAALRNLLIEKQVLEPEELARRMDSLRRRKS